MKSSRKKLILDSEEDTTLSDKEEENPEEEGVKYNEEDVVGAAATAVEAVEEERQQQQKQQQPETLKLEEGYYEIEAIRRKRTRRGQLQYLIKWRGWPESANTWEPIDNLQSCSDVIDAFEERLLKPSRKRKRRSGSSNFTLPVAKNRRSLSAELHTLNPSGEEDHLGGDGNGSRLEGKDANGSLMDVAKKDIEQREACGNTSSQLEKDGFVEDGSSKVECNQPLQGAKKRKSGCVRRFKQVNEKLLSRREKLGGEDVDSTEDDNGVTQKVDETGNPPYLTKILMPVRYHASVTGNEQEVSITFKALRSDGQEVLVDDKDLKINNPLLLISFYEQHVRYNPD